MAGTVALVAAAWLGTAATASAEPAFITKQYTRCTSCHISPTGGGLLSSYGRALSGSELSMTSSHQPASTGTPAGGAADAAPDKESQFLFGALGDSLGPLQLGVELRPAYIRSSFDGFTSSRRILMNADVIGAVQAGKWTFYGEVGREPSPEVTLDSYEHWASYQASTAVGVRVGRFFPAYGVRFADHTSFNREDLGFDKYDQVYGVELSHSTTKSLVQVTLAPGLADSIVEDNGTRSFNAAGRWQVDLGSSTTLVASGIYRAASDVYAKQGSAGLAFGFAPTKKVAVWTQGDVKGDDIAGRSFVFVNETSYEAVRGLWLKVSPQYHSSAGAQPGVMRVALSAMLLPRTHVNLNTTYYRDKLKDLPAAHTWLLQMHLYL